MPNLGYNRGMINPRTDTGSVPATVNYEVLAAYGTSIYIGDVVAIDTSSGNCELATEFDTTFASQSSMYAVSMGHHDGTNATSLPVVLGSANVTFEVQSSFASGSAGQQLVGELVTFVRAARHSLMQVSGHVAVQAAGGLVITSLGSRPDNLTASTDANPVVRVKFVPPTA